MKSRNNKLLIFTKSPILGEVKTRLQPEYSEEQSLVIHKKLMLKTLELTKSIDSVSSELCCAPTRNTLFFLECENNYPVILSNQEGDNLGERMAYSLSIALQKHNKVVIIGTDCPEIDRSYIETAFDALNEFDAVIGPAFDGGYVLLGLKIFSPILFENIDWGTDMVLAQTLEKLNVLEWSYHQLEMKNDIDRPEDVLKFNNFLNI